MAQAVNGGMSGEAAQRGLLGRVREGAASQLSRQKDRATDGLGSVASAVRQSTQGLRDQQHDTIARYADQLAQQLETFALRLRDKSVSEIADDVGRFARQRPALFIGSAFAIGLLGARFFKSSPGHRGQDEGRSRWSGRGYDYAAVEAGAYSHYGGPEHAGVSATAAATPRRAMQRARSRLERAIDQNPLFVAAAALAAGAALGLAVPETQREHTT